MKVINLKEKKEKQLNDALETFLKWKERYKFSLSTLLFVAFILYMNYFHFMYGKYTNWILLIVILFFTQQTIRSYNYMKFHKSTYNFLKLIHKKVDDVIKK